MKGKYIIVSFIVVCSHSFAFSTDIGQINYIKDEYKKVTNLFVNSNKEYDPNISMCEIRQNAMPVTFLSYNRATFYWELFTLDATKEAGCDNEGLRLRKSECYFQKGARSAKGTSVYYEEILFDADGSMLFYLYKEGIGNIFSLCQWQKEERYYFHGTRVIRAVKNGTTDDNPDAKADNKGKEILKQGKFMKALADGLEIHPLETPND